MPAPPDRAKSVFLAALEIPAGDARQAHVVVACEGDEVLLHEVGQLLRHHDEAGAFLEPPIGPIPVADLSGSRTTAAHDTPESAGTLIGPYKLLEEIGEGGMGTVWKAQQTEPVKRLVAVKLIKVGMDSRAVLARFEAERQALALMDHPNIATVLDAGATPDGRPFFVMELVKGQTITAYCDAHRLTPRQRLELFVPVCQAIQHAHQKGVIHRDIKPSNVLVAMYDDMPVPKVIDFGVAKATGQPLTEKTLHTGLGAVVGTPEYMSPEQAGFNQLDVDTRSDIYSLGVLLYELLAGSPPFSRNELEQAGLLEILRVVREQEPQKPSTKLSTADGLPGLAASRGTEPAKLTRQVRGELDWIVMKALEKDRARRYETANGFAADLLRYLADEPVQACPPSAGYRLRKFVRRNKGPVLATTALLSMLLATLAVVVSSNAEVRHALGERTNAFNQLETEQHATADALRQVEAEQRITAEALRRETALKNQETALKKGADDALDQERLALYSYRIALAHREWEAGRVSRAEALLDECPAHLRGWEWYYIKRQCHLDLATFQKFSSPVRSVEWFGDGSIVTLHDAVILNVWNADGSPGTNRKVGPQFIAQQNYTISKQGHFAESDGENVVIRDTASGKAIARFPVGRTPSLCRFSPDGKRLAAIVPEKPHVEKGDVQVWDVATGRQLFRVPTLATHTRIYDFSADGQEFIQMDGADLVIRDSTTGVEKFRRPQRAVFLMASPTGHRLATWDGEGAGRLSVRDYRDGKLIWEVQLRSGNLRAMAFHPSGLFLATAHDDHTIKVWNAQTGQEWFIIRGHNASVNCLAFQPAGNRLVSGGSDGAVKTWDTTAIAERTPPGVPTYRLGPLTLGLGVKAVSLSSDGKLLAASNPAGKVAIWDTKTSKKIVALTANSVALSLDGHAFASFSRDHVVRISNTQTGKEIVACDGKRASVHNLVFSPDGRFLAANCDNSEVVIWDSATGRETKLPEKATGCLIFTPDGRKLVGLSRRGICIWDVDMWAFTQIAGNNVNACVASSRDGRRFAVGGRDQTVTILDARTGEERLILRGQGGNVIALTFHPDGKRLATLTQDGALVIWDLDVGRALLTIPGSPISVTEIVFSPDGHRLYRGTREGAVEVLDATPLLAGPKPKP